MSEQLQDEILSINSIYGAGTLLRARGAEYHILKLPLIPDVTLQLEFPSDYPDAPPSILGTQSTGSSIAKGKGQQIVDVVRTTLAEVFVIGSPCIFDLLEEATTGFQQHDWPKSQVESESEALETGQDGNDHVDFASDIEQQHDVGLEPPWTLSEVVTEKKSVFVARAAPVDSTNQANDFVRHLLVTDKKAARATHNITAWRIRGANGIQHQDCDDDGETAAGGRLLHLLELMDVWNVMVIVTRCCQGRRREGWLEHRDYQ